MKEQPLINDLKIKEKKRKEEEQVHFPNLKVELVLGIRKSNAFVDISYVFADSCILDCA